MSSISHLKFWGKNRPAQFGLVDAAITDTAMPYSVGPDRQRDDKPAITPAAKRRLGRNGRTVANFCARLDSFLSMPASASVGRMSLGPASVGRVNDVVDIYSVSDSNGSDHVERR